jgi:hypothetical protein
MLFVSVFPGRRFGTKDNASTKRAISALATAQASLRHPLVKTECFGRQWASSCSGKHEFGRAPSIVCCRHDDLHSIGTMMGFHAVTLWQNETFHFLYHMNIIIETHFNSQTGKMEANNTSERA